jgi:ABC-type lipoprotein export system ATPase subunit
MTPVKIESLKFEDLSFKYEGPNWLLGEANFNFPMNKFVKIEARNGAGKSTLLRLLAGLLEPSAGSYLINDQKVNDMSFEEFLALRLQIGYSFDMGGLLNNRTLAENIGLPLLYHKICPVEEAERRTREMIEAFGLGAAADKRPSAVRGSDRKATCLARALILEPQILLLDDPTTGLSLDVTQKLIGRMQKQMRGNLKHIFIASDDQKILSEFSLHRIEISEQKLIDLEALEKEKRSSEAA